MRSTSAIKDLRSAPGLWFQVGLHLPSKAQRGARFLVDSRSPDTHVAYSLGLTLAPHVLPFVQGRQVDTSGAALAVSPGGRRVFVTGGATVAYDTGTGARMWARPTDGVAVAVSSTGRCLRPRPGRRPRHAHTRI